MQCNFLVPAPQVLTPRVHLFGLGKLCPHFVYNFLIPFSIFTFFLKKLNKEISAVRLRYTTRINSNSHHRHGCSHCHRSPPHSIWTRAARVVIITATCIPIHPLPRGITPPSKTSTIITRITRWPPHPPTKPPQTKPPPTKTNAPHPRGK